MNSWLLIRRLRGPAFLILVGITALLNQWNVLSFSRSWPLYLILAGVLGLAERAAVAANPPVMPPYPGGYTPGAYPASGYGPAPAYPVPASAPPGSTVVSGSPADDPFADPNRRS
jgi:hypothetical protein